MTHLSFALLYLLIQYSEFTCLPSLLFKLFFLCAYFKCCFSGLYLQLTSLLTLLTLLSLSQLLPRSLSTNGQISWAPDVHVEGLCGHTPMYHRPFKFWISKSELLTLRVSKPLPCPKFYQQVPPAPPRPEPWKLSYFFLSFISSMSKKSLCPIILHPKYLSLLSLTFPPFLPLIWFSPPYSLPSALALFFRNSKCYVVSSTLFSLTPLDIYTWYSSHLECPSSSWHTWQMTYFSISSNSNSTVHEGFSLTLRSTWVFCTIGLSHLI